jgi:hypothetical protein
MRGPNFGGKKFVKPFSREEKERLCTNVEALRQLFSQLMDEEDKKAKQTEGNKKVSVIWQKIRELVWKDLDDLQLNFPHLLTDELINEVEDDLNQSGLNEDAKPKRDDLDTAFNNTFTELQDYLKMDADSRDTDASRKVLLLENVIEKIT